MKTACLGSTTAGRSSMKTTVCCQGTGITPAALPAVLCLQEEPKNKVLSSGLSSGIRPVTQSTRLPKGTITPTLTTMMMNSLCTTTHGGHQRDGCFLPRLKVTQKC